MNLRKKNGWSQEELAEQLSVSRQSVSKWESAQSVPDLNKVIAMAELFGVTTDFLLKDEIEPEEYLPAVPSSDVETVSVEAEPLRRVSMEESQAYLAAAKRASGQISLGVFLCILSPICMILLAAAGETGHIPLSGDQGGIFGVVILLLIVAIAVAIFVKNSMQLSRYEYLEKECIETEYGVSGMVKERRQTYEHTHMIHMIAGITSCVIGAVPLLLAVMLAEDNEMLMAAAVSLLLALIAVGVYLIVKVSVVWESFQKLLEEGDYTRTSKRTRTGLLMTVYWPVVTAFYLAVSFYTMNWARTWIIWPVAGVLWAVIAKIEEARL